MLSRRGFLGTGTLVLGALVPFIPQIACANTNDFWIRDRALWLRRPNGEEFYVVYWSGGQVDVANYVRLCYLLRDAHESQTVMMDVNLLNLLYGLQHWQELLLNRPTPILTTSGYRTSGTNQKTEGAARNSMHLYGRAADIKSNAYSPEILGRMAGFFGMGGVGHYPTFTHVDTGQVRFWNGTKPKTVK
jgi:uncharacterized protein YcbK (DUF882 family)